MEAPVPTQQPPFRVTGEWIDWIAHNLARSVPGAALVGAMAERGCPPELAGDLVRAFARRRADGTAAATPRLAKARWLLESLRGLQHLTLPVPVAERFSIDPEEFYPDDVHCYLSSSLSELDARRRGAGVPALSFAVTLREGDVLFLPLGWWHEVRGLSASISLSATNFRARNDFHGTYDFFGKLDP